MKIVVEVEPRPQARVKFGKGRAYEPKHMKIYKSAVKAAAIEAMAGSPPLEGALSCSIKVWRKYSPVSRIFGDADNHAKAICDALNGVCWKDDAQLVSVGVQKFKSATPRLEVDITKFVLEGEESLF